MVGTMQIPNNQPEKATLSFAPTMANQLEKPSFSLAPPMPYQPSSPVHLGQPAMYYNANGQWGTDMLLPLAMSDHGYFQQWRKWNRYKGSVEFRKVCL